MAHLAETISALKKGVTSLTVDAAVKNIEMWEKELASVNGASAIVADLGKLKTALHAKTPDSKSLKELMTKLSTETKKAAANAGAKKEQVEELATALHV